MQELQKKVNNFINTGMGVSAIFIALGLFFALCPGFSLDVFRWTISLISLAIGSWLISRDISRGFSLLYGSTILGIIFIILGIIFAANPNSMNIFVYIIGAIFVVNSINSLRAATNLPRGTSSTMIAYVTAFLSLICGILLLVNPWQSQISIVVFAGIMMIIYGASNMIDMAIMKKHIKDFSDDFKVFFGVSNKKSTKSKKTTKKVSEAKEAEVVKDTKKSSKK